MLFICIKIFLARILDVSLGTIRTILLSKNRLIEPFVIAFFEVIIWFVVAKEALNISGNTWMIAIFYAGGYATGTLIGCYLSRKFINGIVTVEVILEEENDKLLNKLRRLGYRINVIELKKGYNSDNKEMYQFQINNKKIKEVTNLIKKYTDHAYVTINEIKYVNNGVIK